MNLYPSKFLDAFIIFFAVIIIWEITSRNDTSFININLLPPPSELFPYFIDIILKDNKFLIDVFISLLRVLLGFICATFFGIILGIIASKNKIAERIIVPIIDFIRPIPNIVWLPIIIVIIPSIFLSVIIIPFLGALPPIFLSTISGVKSISPIITENVYLCNIKGYKLIVHVLIPGAFTHIRNGLNIGISSSWLGVVLSEMTAGQNGLGYFTWIAYQSTDYSLMMIGTLTIAFLGFISSKLFLFFTKNIYNPNR